MWGSTIIISNSIETVCHQTNPLIDVTHMHKLMTMYTKNGDIVKNNMASLRSKNETVVLRMIYSK